MAYLNIEGSDEKCPKCKRIAIKLISLTDDGKGKRYCKRCKKGIRKSNPNKDFRKEEVA